MKLVTVLLLSFISFFASAQNPTKIKARYISQEASKNLDLLNDPDIGTLCFKDNSLRKIFQSSTDVDSFLASASLALAQQKNVVMDEIFILSATGQEPEYTLTWDETLQQYTH